MHKQTAFTVMVTVCAIIGVTLWELGLQKTKPEATAVKNSIAPPPRADWSNYFEASLLVSVFIAFYIRLYASYYAINKINRALSIACILLFAAVVIVLVKTAPCGTAYDPYAPCFEVMTGIAFGFALLDLVIFLIWKGLFHYSSSASLPQDVVIVKADVEAPVVKEVEVKSEAALEKEAEAKKEEEAAAEAKKEEEAKEEEKKEEEEEKKEEAQEEKAEEPSEAQPLLQEPSSEEKKDEEKKE